MSGFRERLQAVLGDGYVVERELGGGGMSRVFVALDRELGRRVVVKVLPPERAARVDMGRFRREIHLAASLQHPHIVPLLTAHRVSDLVYYTMPLIDGESLRARLDRHGALPIGDVLRILRDIVDAIAYAHTQGVVHRDIKPDNVLLSGEHAMVTDFGIAKALSEAGKAPTVTTQAVAVGTPAYMAPEQAAADPRIDQRADIYAVGALAYELLSGRPPFTGITTQEVLAAQVGKAPEGLGELRPTVPPALAELVMRCLEKNPDDRWQTGQELLAHLQALTTPTEFAAALAASRVASIARWPRLPMTVVAGIAGAFVLTAALWLVVRTTGRRGGPAPAPSSVAVLYFAARDTAYAYVADGLTEDITTLLGNVASVQVRSPSMVRRAQHATVGNLTALARALGVRYLVDGSVRRAGGRVHVSARLVVGATAVTSWGEVFDLTSEELLAVPPVIAREVAARVGGRLQPGEATGLALRPTRNPAAYDHYLHGNFFIALRTPESLSHALGEYSEAERLDSGFAAAIGRAAYTYALARASFADAWSLPVDSLTARGLAMADRALTRDSSASDAWMARGYLLAFANRRTLAGAPEAFERAIALDPRNAEAHHQYAQILNWLGRHDEADRELHLALALEPGRVISLADLAGWTRYRDTALALRWADSAVRVDPASALARFRRSQARLLAGDVAGAREDAEMSERLMPGIVFSDCLVAMVLVRTGDTTRARNIVQRWTAEYEGMGLAMVAAAVLALGDTSAALDKLERTELSAELWSLLQRPEFDGLRGNPRFERVRAATRPPRAVGP